MTSNTQSSKRGGTPTNAVRRERARLRLWQVGENTLKGSDFFLFGFEAPCPSPEISHKHKDAQSNSAPPPVPSHLLEVHRCKVARLLLVSEEMSQQVKEPLRPLPTASLYAYTSSSCGTAPGLTRLCEHEQVSWSGM